MNNNVTIIVPAFNEEESIESVASSLLKAFPECRILIIDDGSTDETAQMAEKTGATVVRHTSNQGYGASLRTGILKAQTTFVLFCDADGQHRIEDVRHLMEARDEYDMIVGTRNADSHTPLNRAPGKFILKHFANFLAGEKIPDLNSGLRILRRDVILKYIHLMPRGFSFSTTSTFALLKGYHDIALIPIIVQKRKGSSTVRQLKHGPQTMLLMLRLTVLFEPLKVFLSAAATLMALSLTSLGIDIWSSGRFDIGDSTVLLSITTLLTFLFGLVCDQVSAIRRELHD